MKTFKQLYKECWTPTMVFPRQSKSRSNDKALDDLAMADQNEIFVYDAYLEGLHYFRNEDKSKMIEIGYTCTAGVNLMQYMTIKDILDIDTDIQYVQITLYK